MSDPRTADPDCVVRAHAAEDGRVLLHSRTHSFAAEGQTSYAPSPGHPSALDYLLAALAADLVAGLAREAARAGFLLEAVELSLAGRLENPLAPLGVVGESGSARLAEVSGSLYVSADAPEEALRERWEAALSRAPVYATLAASTNVDITLKLVL